VWQAWPEGGAARGGTVLDVGCGPGWLWSEAGDAVPQGLRLVLTDLSAGMVREAVPRVRTADRLASVTGAEADAQLLPFADEAFGTVVANHMLYHVPEPARAVAELDRVRSPEGMVLVAAHGTAHLAPFWEIIRTVFGDTVESDVTARFDTTVGRRLLEARFSRVEARRYDDELRCTDADDLVAYLTSLPPADEATPTERAHLEQAVHERIARSGGVLVAPKDVVLFMCS
jgi:SAM-dependent methyltransferase